MKNALASIGAISLFVLAAVLLPVAALYVAGRWSVCKLGEVWYI